MVRTVNDEIQKNLRLIKYDRSATLIEQNQSTQDATSVSNFNPELLTNEQVYPNYCSRKDKAVMPPDINGQSGLIDGYCFYIVPSQKRGSTAGKHIPKDAQINFWSDLEQYDKIVSAHMQKHPEDNEDSIIEIFSEIFPMGTVASFTFNGQKYVPWITRPDSEIPWTFKGFYRVGDNKPYEQPKWQDDRTQYQKFIDEWGIALQLTAAVATVVAGAVTGGSSWVLTAEILTELGLGIAVGLRELEKGNNVSGALSFIFGLLPMLKLSKTFKGLSETALNSVSQKIKSSGLTSSSTFKDYLKFYRTLTDEEQKVMSQILTQDEIARKQLFNELSTVIDDEIPKLVMNQISKNPEILKDLKFWDKLWARELTSNTVVLAVGLAVEALFGKKLNDQEKQKISELYTVIPKEHSKEFFYNLAVNGNNISEILAKIPSKDVVGKIINTSKVSSNVSKWYNTKLKNAVDSVQGNGTYVEIPTDSTKSAESIQLTNQKISRMRKNGWVPENELNNREWYELALINGGSWYKITPE